MLVGRIGLTAVSVAGRTDWLLSLLVGLAAVSVTGRSVCCWLDGSDCLLSLLLVGRIRLAVVFVGRSPWLLVRLAAGRTDWPRCWSDGSNWLLSLLLVDRLGCWSDGSDWLLSLLLVDLSADCCSLLVGRTGCCLCCWSVGRAAGRSDQTGCWSDWLDGMVACRSGWLTGCWSDGLAAISAGPLDCRSLVAGQTTDWLLAGRTGLAAGLCCWSVGLAALFADRTGCWSIGLAAVSCCWSDWRRKDCCFGSA